ncbi:MAG: hypothetical protein AAFN92_02960, partial [Bacteroidota bacterium]
MAVTLNNKDFLSVPISLDALVVPAQGLTVLDPHLDFTRLPYLGAPGDDGVSVLQNEGTPYLAESALSQPFNDRNSVLAGGIHLHWSLPDVLSRAIHVRNDGGEQVLEFPAAPNRWFIHRKSSAAGLDDEFWQLHPDFLWPDNVEEILGGDGHEYLSPTVTYHHQTPRGPGNKPYAYLGLIQRGKISRPLQPPTDGRYLDKLTTVGYGEPLFAAFYPDCRGVFGLHDNLDGVDPARVDLRKITYEVWGWYEDEEQDFLHRFTSEYRPEKYGGKDLRAALIAEMGWDIAGDDDTLMPGRLLCRSKLTFSQASAPNLPQALAQQGDFKIAMGNTGSEALSAFIATELAGSHPERKRLENQIESLHLKTGRDDHLLDLGALFEESRHDKTFKPTSGGRVWTLRSETAEAAQEEVDRRALTDHGLIIGQLRDFHVDLGAATL